MITDLTELKEQENQLQFSRFDCNSAWELGRLIRDKASADGVNVAINITLNGLCLFSCSMPETSIDNLKWIERKNNVVNRYQKSSWYMGQYYKQKGSSIGQSSLVDEKEFAAYGGSFPLRIKNVGVVGTIAVSGLPQYEDHKLVVESVQEFLQSVR